MKSVFSDTFFDSLERVINRERWYWKTWDFIRYDAPRFFKNIWLFRKALYNYRWYGGHYSVLPFMETAIADIADNVDRRGNEIRSSAEKKVKMMRRTVEILNHFKNDSFIDLAEKELGKLHYHAWEFEDVPGEPGLVQMKDNVSPENKNHNHRVYDRAREIEENEWKELWTILEGQDYNKFARAPEGKNHDESYDYWERQFDGSGLRTWWD